MALLRLPADLQHYVYSMLTPEEKTALLRTHRGLRESIAATISGDSILRLL